MSATDRKQAAQAVRAVTRMATVSPNERHLLTQHPADIEVLEAVLASYETRQVWQAGHGDVPLKLRRAIRLLQKDAASKPQNHCSAEGCTVPLEPHQTHCLHHGMAIYGQGK